MSVKGCSRAMKWVLIVTNLFILITGAIAIGLGAWGLASEYGAEKLKALTGSEFYRGAAIAIIVGGCVMVVVAFLGFFGALMENKVLLGIYFTLMLLLLILFVVATVVSFIYRDTLAENITMQMNNTLLHQYGVNLNNSDNNDITNLWNDLQKNLGCCGVRGRTPDSDQSWYLWQNSDWFKMQRNNLPPTALMYVPQSCCNPNDNGTCTSLNSNPSKPVQMSVLTITSANDALYYKGCYDALLDEMREHVLAIAGIALAIVILMFLSLILTIGVCASIRRHKMVV